MRTISREFLMRRIEQVVDTIQLASSLELILLVAEFTDTDLCLDKRL